MGSAAVSGTRDLFNYFRFTRGRASGMNTDAPVSQQPENTYRNAWGISNASSDEKGGGIYNMPGMWPHAKLPEGSDIRGQHFLEERNHMIVFLDIGGKSEIGYWSTDTGDYKKIIDDSNITGCKLGFGTKEWIPIVSKSMPNGTCNEIHIYWSNGNVYKTLNIDRPCVPIPCDKINLFRAKCLPTPKAFVTEKGGFDLEAGARQYFAQLEDEDKNTTNWFAISNPIYVGSKNNRAGEPSEHAVNITIDQLDPEYPYVNLGCIETIGGVPTAKCIAKLSYSPNGASFFHRSKSQFLFPLEIEEILVKNPEYINGNDLFQHDRVLYLFNTKPVRELDMQSRIIDSVKAKINVGRVPMRYAHMFSGLQRNAVYSFGLHYNGVDGRPLSRDFHIAATGIMPTEGKGCSECVDKNFSNASPPTQVNGKPYDNPIQKGPDEYTPYTETKLNNLNNSDFDLPDDDQFVPPAGSDADGDCACWAMRQAFEAFANRPWNWQGFEAAFNFFKSVCDSGCVDVDTSGLQDGQITPRSDVISNEADPMPTADDGPPDARFKKLDDIDLKNGEKPSTSDITGSAGQGSDGNNSDTTNTVHSGSSESTATSGNNPIDIKKCEPKIIYADGDCCVIKEIIPCIDEVIDPIVYLSCERYPNEERCCAGGKTYGKYAGDFIRYFRMPTLASQPHFVSYHDGVPTAEHRDNHEYNNSFARFLWIEFSDIPLPNPDELDIPLCPSNPFTITWEQRNPEDDTVLASGVIFPTFEGETLGETMLFPAHGSSSPEKVDRWINNKGSHRTSIAPTVPAYVFFSPDTSFDRPPLRADYMHNAMSLTGRGWLHHLYAEGLDPDTPYVGKKNRKGAVSSMNLNKWEVVPNNDIRCIAAISHVPENSILDKADEFTKSLNNLNRPSTVFVETDGTRIEMVDTSFDRDVETHQKPLTGAAQYVSLDRFVPNAYGGITDNIYYAIWQGLGENVKDGKATVMVRAGDTFINYWSIKRPSYVSNHVARHPRGIKPNFEYGGGITLPWPFKSIFKRLFNTISADCNCGAVPQAGNAAGDPRANNAENGSATADRYFPQVQTQLISVPVESRVNLGFQGSGDDVSQSTYRDLNGQTFDSSFDGGDGAYERSWMDRYYATMCENAKWKCGIRAVANFIFTYVIGIVLILKGLKILTDALTGTEVGLVITVMSVVAAGMGLLLMLVGFIWIIAWANTDLDNRMIDNILQITDCFPDKRPKRNGDGDAEMKDSRVQGFEDNYYEYNYDFSLINKIEAFPGLPAGWDPCHCPNETSYPVWHSNPQNPQSKRDAYRNFKTNGYFLIPSHHGKPQTMFNIGSAVFLQTTDVMFQIISGNVEMKADGSNVYLETTGRFLQSPQLIVGSLPEGGGGTNDPNAGESTKWGRISFDTEGRQIYLFDGQSYQPLGDFGMSKFLDKYMPFEALEANPKIVRDERSKGGIGYSVGADNARNILFITKTDKRGDKDRSWTLSFDMENQAWIGYEYFTPLVYARDRFKLFSYNENTMWGHNKVGEFSTVYGKRVPMMIDFVITDPKTLSTFRWQNSIVSADFDKYDKGLIPLQKMFFSHIGAYNTYQSSGLMPIVVNEELPGVEKNIQDPTRVPVSDLHRDWRIKKLINKVHTNGQRLMTSQDDNFFTTFNTSILGDKMIDNEFTDNYMVVRLVWDVDDTKIRVLLKHVKTMANPEIY